VSDVSAPVILARKSLEYYLLKGEIMSVPDNNDTVLLGTAGVFVSLKKNGDLRGCIGTFRPTQPTIAAEIIQNAVSAGIDDPRFNPVSIHELADLTITVDILSLPEQVESLEELDPKKYGVIVCCGRRSGLLLPDLEGVNSIGEQVAIARQKAGIGPGEEIELYRFSVTRYK